VNVPRRPLPILVAAAIAAISIITSSASARILAQDNPSSGQLAVSYDWQKGSGTSGWTFSSDPADLFASATEIAETKGLWLWPAGGEYGPEARGAWRYSAPGTTAIGAATVTVSYRPNVLAQLCLVVRLKKNDAVLVEQSLCKPKKPAGGVGSWEVVLEGASEPGDTISVSLERPACDKPGSPSCTKAIDPQDPAADGGFARVDKAELALLDSDPPSLSVSGPLRELADKYINGQTSYALKAVASDEGVGIERVWVETGDGSVLAVAKADCDPLFADSARPCAKSFSPTLDVSTISLPEGKNSFVVKAADAAGNIVSSAPWEILVDRTSPELASNIAIDEYSTEGPALFIHWDSGPDPALLDGSPGSGLDTTEYRVTVNGGAWSEWTNATSPEAEMENVFWEDVVGIQVRETDSVGNQSDAQSTDVRIPTPDWAVDEPWNNPRCFQEGNRASFSRECDPPVNTDLPSLSPYLCDGTVEGLCGVTADKLAAYGLYPPEIADIVDMSRESLGQSEEASSAVPSQEALVLDIRQWSARGAQRAERARSSVVVPNVIGLQLISASQILLGVGLAPYPVGTWECDIPGPGCVPTLPVVATIPAPGEVTETGTIILLFNTESGETPPGNESVEVPLVRGKTLAEARSTLTTSGFTVRVEAGDYTEDTPVYQQSPAAHTYAPKGSEVSVTFLHGRPSDVSWIANATFGLLKEKIRSNPCASSVSPNGYCGFYFYIVFPMATIEGREVQVGLPLFWVFKARSGGPNEEDGANDPSRQWEQNRGPAPERWRSSERPTGQSVRHLGWDWIGGQSTRMTAYIKSYDDSFYPEWWPLTPIATWEGTSQSGRVRSDIQLHGGRNGHGYEELGTHGCVRLQWQVFSTVNTLWDNWTDNKAKSPGPPFFVAYEH
jgi:hypothetical protein